MRQPRVDCPAQLVEFTGKEVIDPFHDHEPVLSRERGDERFDFSDGAMLVLAPMHK